MADLDHLDVLRARNARKSGNGGRNRQFQLHLHKLTSRVGKKVENLYRLNGREHIAISRPGP
jgi:hypothetical protein